MSNDSIEALARSLAEAVPEGLKSVRADLEQNFRAVLSAGLGKLDLVSREEFEVQEAVLARSREMLVTLEGRLETLEAMTEEPHSGEKAKQGKKARKPAAKKSAKKTAGKKSTR